MFHKALAFLFIALSLPCVAGAAELVQDTQVTEKAVVEEILNQETRTVPGTDTKATYQTLTAKILEGEERGRVVTVENDFLNLRVGEKFYLVHTTNELEARDTYTVLDPYRLNSLFILACLFLFLLVLFGGIQGIRGFVALVGGFLLIFYVMLPELLAGASPILVSVGVASLIVVVGSYITHGFNKTTTAAVLGMVATLLITGVLARYAVDISRLSGFASEEAVYLNLGTRGSLDFAGLLLGGMLIGILGVLYDAAIGQAVSVEELYRANPAVTRKVLYTRALRIGREHIGALVNTLAIAYVGVSIPLLLIFYNSSESMSVILNREIFSTEIVRILVGSMGLILAVPLTTIISVLILVKDGKGRTLPLFQKKYESEYPEHNKDDSASGRDVEIKGRKHPRKHGE